MKDLMKHLPLTLSVLTFLLVGMMWMDVTPKGGCQDCTSMRGRMSQGMERMKARGSKGDTGRMRREEGKRGPKKEDK